MIGGGVHGAEQLMMDRQRIFQVAPDGFHSAGACRGEFNVAQTEKTLGQGQDHKGVLDPTQAALEDVDGEDAADADDAAVGQDVGARGPLE